jgi:hypothetical protein
MLLEYEGRRYEILEASSIGYGMGVEAWDRTSEPQEEVLFAFQFDVDGRIEFSCYRENIPFHLLEAFVHEVQRRLSAK